LTQLIDSKRLIDLGNISERIGFMKTHKAGSDKAEPIKDGIHGCLVCGDPPLPGKKLVRGLCLADSKMYSRALEGITDPDERQKFEEAAIARGHILPAGKPGRKVERNVFAELAEELLSPENKKVIEETKKLSAKLDESIAKHQAKKGRGGK
jgi:hypothetical protein